MPEAQGSPNPPQQTSYKPQRFNWKNALLMFLIGATVIFAGVSTYYFLQLNSTTPTPQLKPPKVSSPSATLKPKQPTVTPDETVGWKTYNDGRFEFKYPKDWTTIDTSTTEIEAYSVRVQDKEGSSFDSSVWFAVNTPTGPDLGPAGTSQSLGTKNLETNGTTLEFGEWVRKDDGRWYLVAGDLKLYIEAFSLKSPSPELRSNIENIIKSFKLLKPK